MSRAARFYNWLDWERYHHSMDDSYPRIAAIFARAQHIYSIIHRALYWHPGWGFGPGPQRTWYTDLELAQARERALSMWDWLKSDDDNLRYP